MHPELKAYLDDYYARTMARYDAMDRLHDAMLSKLLAGISTPQPACPMGTVADGGLTDDATVPAVVPAAFCTTTQAQEAPAVAHDAPPVYIEMAPVTCSTECLTQVDAVTSVDEVQDAVTTIYPEQAVNLSHKEVVQLIPVQATPSIGISTSSSTEVVSSAATTTVVNPKAGVQDLGALSVNTFPPAASELDHSVAFFVASNLTAPAPAKYSAEPPAHESDRVKLLFTTTDAFPRLVSPVTSELYHDDVIDPINIAAPTSTCTTGVLDHLCNERMRPAYTEQQQWPPPIPVQIVVNNAALFHGIARGCVYGDSGYVWWPPDHQLRMRNESQARLSPTQHASVVVHLFHSVKNPGTLSAELSSQNDLQLMQFKQKQYSPDRALYNAEVQSTGSRLQNAIQLWALDISAGFNMAGLEEISCHGIFAIHTGYLISCMSRPCPWPSFDCFHEGAQLRYTWPKITSVMHHFAGSLHSPTEPLRCRQRMHLKLLCSSFSSNCQAVQLWSKLPTVEFQISAHGSTDPNLMRESWWCLQKIIYKISHMEHLFRPRPWRSLKYDSVAGYLEEPSSGTHHQPHEVSGFSVELVPLPFSDVSSPQVPSRQSNSMEESFCRLPGAKLQSGRPPDRATAGNIIQMPHVRVRISHMGHWFRPRPWPSFKYDSNASHPEESCSGIRSRPHDISGFSSGLVLLLFRDEDYFPVCCCELIPMEEPFICLRGAQLPSDATQETVRIVTVSIQQQFLSQGTFKWRGPFAGSCISFALGGAVLTRFYIESSKCSSQELGDLLVNQTCLTVKHPVSLQPWSSNTKVPCFTDFASRSRHLSWSHFHAYQNGSSFRMSWDPGNHIMSNLEKPFSCFQGIQLQSRHTPDRTKSGTIKSSREEAIHWEQVHYKDLQFSPYSLEQPLESDEKFIPYQTTYEFDLEGNKIKSDCSLYSGTHLVGTRLLLIELESYILADSKSTPYACIACMSHGFASSRPATHPVHEFGYNNKALQQEDISWNSGSSPSGYSFHNHCCRYPCCIVEELNSMRVQNSGRSNGQHAASLVPRALHSCEPWDPGGLDFARMQDFEYRVLLIGSLLAPQNCSSPHFQGKAKTSQNQWRTGTGLGASRLLRRRGCQRPKYYKATSSRSAANGSQGSRPTKRLVHGPDLNVHHTKADYKYQRGEQQTRHPGLDQAKATAASSLPLPPVLPPSPNLCIRA